MFSYSVRCSFSDPSVGQSWLAWLVDEHVDEVLQAGAKSAEIFKVDGGDIYEIRYRFVSREAFETYEREHADRLRADGLNCFPLDLGLTYSRTTAESISVHHRKA